MPRCSCGGLRCSCSVIAGPGVTVAGNGSTSAPFVISAGDGGGTVTCDQVRPCLSAGPGIEYDPATGIIAAPPADLVTGCGLTGAGTDGSPLAAATGAWPYECPIDAIGGVVACDSAGVLRSEPRGFVAAYSYTETRTYTNLAVPAGFDQLADTFTTTVTNPGCRPALVWLEREVDVDFDLPAGAGAAYGHGGDEVAYHRNTGSSVEQDFHVQTTKSFGLADTLLVGETRPLPFEITLGRGSGGATYNRIQIFIRVLLIGV